MVSPLPPTAMSPRSQLFIITALSGLGFLLNVWFTPRIHDMTAAVFLWVSWIAITTFAMGYNGQAFPATAFLSVLLFIAISAFAFTTELPQFRAFLLVFWVVTSIGLLNSDFDPMGPTPPKREAQIFDNSELPDKKPEFTVPPPSDVKPINMLSIGRKKGGIKGHFVIDPSLFIPERQYVAKSQALLEHQLDKKNIVLKSDSGAIDVDIWVLNERGLVKMQLEANQEINVRLRTEIHSGPKIVMTAVQGADKLAVFQLPRTFEGFLHIDTAPRPKLAEDIHQRSTLLVDTDEEKTYFIGDLKDLSDRRNRGIYYVDHWTGESVHATGQAHFRYLDEEAAASSGVK